MHRKKDATEKDTVQIAIKKTLFSIGFIPFIGVNSVLWTQVSLHDLTGFCKAETRAARMELARIAVAEVAEEV